MRIHGATVQKLMLGIALLSALAWNLAQASEIKGLEVTAGATGTRAQIALDQPAQFKVIRLSAPDRLVLDFPGSRIPSNVALPDGAGVVRSVRRGQPEPGVARLVFDLSESVAAIGPRLEQGAQGPRLVLEWPGEYAQANTARAPTQPVNAAATQNAIAAPTTTVVADGAAVPVARYLPPAAPPRTDAEVSAASAAATSRLISDMARRTAVPSASPVQSAPTPTTSAPAGAPSATGSISAAPDRSTVFVPPANPATVTSSANANAAPTVAPAPPTLASTEAPVSRPLDEPLRNRALRPLVIAIDPGHGGQDPGAIGQQGKREKDVTLAIARELARQINATPGLKAYLTRDGDVFIPLNRRAQLARQARADMFVSIHADAAENRSANGSSVYVLSLKGASSQRARWLADKENASDLVGGVRLEPSSTLTSVLLDLTQSGQMKASEDAATHVLTGLGRLGRNHKPHVESANFAVLRTSDMPAMLVETAFISNPDEEKRLTDPASQRQIARAVLDGVNTYFVRQPPPGTLYAARAAAQASASATAASSP